MKLVVDLFSDEPMKKSTNKRKNEKGAKLNTKMQQYMCLMVIAQVYAIDFPMHDHKFSCFENDFSDRIKTQIIIRRQKGNSVSIDNVRELNKNNTCHPMNLVKKMRLSDIDRKMRNKMSVYLVYIIDEIREEAHACVILVEENINLCGKMKVYIVDCEERQIDGSSFRWKTLLSEGARSELDLFMRFMHPQGPECESSLKEVIKIQVFDQINPQSRSENNSHSGFCSAWSIFVIHMVSHRLQQSFLGAQSFENVLKTIQLDLFSFSTVALRRLIKLYSNDMKNVVMSCKVTNQCKKKMGVCNDTQTKIKAIGKKFDDMLKRRHKKT